jgi:hypothetical protein
MRSRALLLALVLLAILGLAGCFNPKLEPGFTCGDADPGPECPAGFFCDFMTRTCLRTGTRSTPGVPLGPALPGLVAARLGDGVAVAGWFVDSSQTPTFQVLRFTADGSTLWPPSPQPIFDDVDPGTLKAAGAGDMAVLTGRVPGTTLTPDHVKSMWVWRTQDTVEAHDEGEMTAHAVTSSPSRVCFARAYAGTPQARGVDLVCRKGTTDPVKLASDHDAPKPFIWVTAAISDDASRDMVFVEAPDVIGSKHEMFGLCAGRAQSPSLGQFDPDPSAASLRPHAVRWSDDVAYVGWIAAGRLMVSAVTVDASTCTAGNPYTYPDPVSRFAVTGGPGTDGGRGIRGMTLSDDAHAIPAAQDWVAPGLVPTITIVIDPAHTFLDNPHAVTDGKNDFWFLFFASDSNEQQGWIKSASWNLILEKVVAVPTDGATFTSDFAAAPRTSGGLFLVTRDNPEGHEVNLPLPAYLSPMDASPVDQSLSLVRPAYLDGPFP